MASYTDLEERYPKLLGSLKKFNYFPIETLTSFQRVIDRIELSWGLPEGSTQLHHLIFSNRSNRQGFPPVVLVELMFLKEVHEFELSPPASQDEVSVGTPKIELLPVPPQGFRLTSLLPRLETDPEVAEVSLKYRSGREFIEWPIVKSSEELLQRAREKGWHKKNDLTPPPRHVGEILLRFGRISEAQLAEVIAQQNVTRPRRPIGQELVLRKLISEDELIKVLCVQQQVILADPVTILPSPELLKLTPLPEAEKKAAVPLLLHENTIYLAVENPFQFSESHYFKFLSGKHIELVQSSGELIKRALVLWQHLLEDNRRQVSRLTEFEAVIGTGDPAESNADLPEDAAETGDDHHSSLELEVETIDQSDSSVIGLVNRIFSDANKFGASDIHFEIFPRSKAGQVRFRHDGVLEAYADIPKSYYPAVVSRIKIMAGIDIAEKRRPQDGRLSVVLDKHRIAMRVATLPTSTGQEGVVVRLLNQNMASAIDDINLADDILDALVRQISKPHGLILVCGPTGSGKTTTLHSILRFLNTPHRKIWTAEDPIEITQHNINQVQINHKIDLDFPSVLRSFLRADPDVIMIGEMRDAETAKIAVESSMTGHLVLSTLHTNSAAETVARVLDLGVDQYSFSDALRAVLAQRLVRKLCDECAETFEGDVDTINALAEEYFYSAANKNPTYAQRDEIIARWRKLYAQNGKFLLRNPKGCDKCMGTGYRGRLGIHELLCFDNPKLVRMIRGRAPAEHYREAGIADGMHTLKQDGIDKVIRGDTTLVEIRAACI